MRYDAMRLTIFSHIRWAEIVKPKFNAFLVSSLRLRLAMATEIEVEMFLAGLTKPIGG